MRNDERNPKPELRRAFSFPFGVGFVIRIWSFFRVLPFVIRIWQLQSVQSTKPTTEPVGGQGRLIGSPLPSREDSSAGTTSPPLLAPAECLPPRGPRTLRCGCWPDRGNQGLCACTSPAEFAWPASHGRAVFRDHLHKYPIRERGHNERERPTGNV